MEKETQRSELIRKLYNSYHEGEAELPNAEEAKNYIFDEGTGTLYCKETNTQYQKTELEEAISYFSDVAQVIEAELYCSADPYKQGKKASFCRIASEAIEYMRASLEREIINKPTK